MTDCATDSDRCAETVEGGSAFNPLTLSPVLWLKADAGLYQSAGGAAAAADADPVGQWQDQSGNVRHFAQATASKKPTLRLAAQNGLPVVRFDGVDDLLELLANLGAFDLTAADLTFFFALKWPTTKAGFWSAGTAGPNYANAEHYGLQRRDGANFAAHTGNGDGLIPDALADGTWYVLTVRADGPSNWSLRADGVAVGSAVRAVYSNPVAIALGAGGDGLPSPFSGDIGEVLVLSGLAAAADQTAVETYMARWK